MDNLNTDNLMRLQVEQLEKEKKELMDRENRRREQAKGKADRLAKGGKKKA